MEDTARSLVVSVVTEHAESLLRVAQRYTDCPADAEDAYQRAMEIFVKSAGRLNPETAFKWLHTVVKHEAFAVREQRAKLVGVERETILDFLEEDGRHLTTVEERSERFDEMLRAAEALRRLKPQEVTALVLKAQGLSYQEIASRQGWTYTKVNRCLTEGRRSFLARFEGIVSGEECARWTEILSAMADGEASARDLMEVRPHLRNCAACRATLGEMQRAPAAAAALVPVGGLSFGLLDRLGWLFASFGERVAAPVVKAQSALEASSATKVAAVGASVAALGGGGVAVKSGVAERPARASSPPARVAAPPPVAPARVASPVVAPAAPARGNDSARTDSPPSSRQDTSVAAPEREEERSPQFAAPELERPSSSPPAPSPPAPEPEPRAPAPAPKDEFGFE